MASYNPAAYLTTDECIDLVEALSLDSPSGIRNRALLAVLWRCGLRYEEAIGLRPVDLDFSRRFIQVGDLTDGTARRIPLRGEAGQLVRSWSVVRTNQIRRHRAQDEFPFFFTIEKNRFGHPLSEAYLRGLVRRVAKKAGVRRPMHKDSLREARWIELMEGGYPAQGVAGYLGDPAFLEKPFDPQDPVRYLMHRQPIVAAQILSTPWDEKGERVVFWTQAGPVDIPGGPSGLKQATVRWQAHEMDSRGGYFRSTMATEALLSGSHGVSEDKATVAELTDRVLGLENQVATLSAKLDQILAALQKRKP